MLGILADNSAHALAFAVAPDDEAAILANGGAGWANFHCVGVTGGGGTGAAAGACPGCAGEPGDVGENRYTMRPLFRSYGVISSFTLSPGRIRTR